MTVVIPISIPLHKAREYEIELIGVVPKADLIEKATPKDMMNKPKTNKNILFNILLIYIY